MSEIIRLIGDVILTAIQGENAKPFFQKESGGIGVPGEEIQMPVGSIAAQKLDILRDLREIRGEPLSGFELDSFNQLNEVTIQVIWHWMFRHNHNNLPKRSFQKLRLLKLFISITRQINAGISVEKIAFDITITEETEVRQANLKSIEEFYMAKMGRLMSTNEELAMILFSSIFQDPAPLLDPFELTLNRFQVDNVARGIRLPKSEYKRFITEWMRVKGLARDNCFEQDDSPSDMLPVPAPSEQSAREEFKDELKKRGIPDSSGICEDDGLQPHDPSQPGTDPTNDPSNPPTTDPEVQNANNIADAFNSAGTALANIQQQHIILCKDLEKADSTLISTGDEGKAKFPKLANFTTEYRGFMENILSKLIFEGAGGLPIVKKCGAAWPNADGDFVKAFKLFTKTYDRIDENLISDSNKLRNRINKIRAVDLTQEQLTQRDEAKNTLMKLDRYSEKLNSKFPSQDLSAATGVLPVSDPTPPPEKFPIAILITPEQAAEQEDEKQAKGLFQQALKIIQNLGNNIIRLASEGLAAVGLTQKQHDDNLRNAKEALDKIRKKAGRLRESFETNAITSLSTSIFAAMGVATYAFTDRTKMEVFTKIMRIFTGASVAAAIGLSQSWATGAIATSGPMIVGVAYFLSTRVEDRFRPDDTLIKRVIVLGKELSELFTGEAPPRVPGGELTGFAVLLSKIGIFSDAISSELVQDFVAGTVIEEFAVTMPTVTALNLVVDTIEEINNQLQFAKENNVIMSKDALDLYKNYTVVTVTGMGLILNDYFGFIYTSQDEKREIIQKLNFQYNRFLNITKITNDEIIQRVNQIWETPTFSFDKTLLTSPNETFTRALAYKPTTVQQIAQGIRDISVEALADIPGTLRNLGTLFLIGFGIWLLTNVVRTTRNITG